MNKFVLYTAVFGKASRFREPIISTNDIDKFCFTDLGMKNKFYQIRKMQLDHLDPVRRNRFAKILIPDEIFDNYEYSLYLDYKHPMGIDFEQLLGRLGRDFDMLISKHKKRDCVYDEGVVCIEKKKDDKKTIQKQLAYYASKNYPTHNGLYAAYWIFRRHTEQIREFMKFWWKQVEKFSCRDQISLPYVAWKHGMEISSCRKAK